MENKLASYETGAFRNANEHKFDYEGFLSPLALERFAKYMHANRKQRDGSIRDSDNWQKGIPRAAYMKSLWRHMVDTWKIYRGYIAINPDTDKPTTLEDSLCGILFNSFGLLHELEKDKECVVPRNGPGAKPELT